MQLISPNPIVYLLFILVALVPAWFLNKYLLKWIGPKKSFAHFFGYLLAVLVVVLLFAFMVSFAVLKFVWSSN
jgi:hypothetical protein